MTREEKARAYDEALERAQRVTRAGSDVAMDIVQYIFPQLTESEDERIRKALIDALKMSETVGELKFRLPEPTREEAIAYLEKQKEEEGYEEIPVESTLEYKLGFKAGKESEKQKDNKFAPRVLPCSAAWFEDGEEKQKEQKPELPKPHKGDDNNPYDMSVSEAQEYAINRGFGVPFNDGEVYVDERHITQTIGNILRWADEHPKEQKPVEYLSKEKVFAIMKKLTSLSFCVPLGSDEEKQIHEITCDVRSLLDYPIEQKQDWSEEDEMMRENIISDLRYFRDCETDEESVSDYDDEINWLKDISLNHKKFIEAVDKLWSNEWSEEDENIIKNLIELVEAQPAKDFYESSKDTILKRLKSLRPQYYGDVTMTEAYKMGVEVGKASSFKPSEEQMEALRRAINKLAKTDVANSVRLSIMYDNLKRD